MKIVVIGTRGIPNILGGVETHCEELYPRIAAMGHDVTVIRRTPYIKENNRITEYKGVKLVDVYAPRKKSIEAIVHTLCAVVRAKRMNPDILHVHAIGPAIMIPIARLLGLKVVMTNHGPDYDRQKWGRMAKTVLKLGERLGTRFSNRVIVISKVIAGILSDKYGRTDVDLVFNGVNVPKKSHNVDFLQSKGIVPGRYMLALGRFVKEKGFHDLIDAYNTLGSGQYQLVIAGDADHEDQYSRKLKCTAKEAGVVLTGFIKGEELNQIMSNAALFVMPSYHEGLPIALLEAMSYNIDVLVSDIPANVLDCLSENDFFKVGNVSDLVLKLKSKLDNLQPQRIYDLNSYDWDKIAAQTVEVYRQV